MIKKCLVLIHGVLFLTLVGSGVSYARAKSAVRDTVPRGEYEKLKQEVEALKAQVQSLMENDARAREQLKPAQALKAPEAPAKTPERKEEEKTATAQAEAAPPAPKKKPPEMGLQEGDREKEAEESRLELDQFLRSQKVLFKKGDLQVEFSASYSHDTVEVPPVKLETRTAGTGVLFRYGLIDDLELDISVPFAFSDQQVDPNTTRILTNPPQRFDRNDNSGLGDVSGSLRWGAWHEEGFMPETTLSLNVKSDTGDVNRILGTGFWNVGAAVSLVKTIDPVVLFGSLGYNAVLEKSGVDPGDQVLYSLGMGFSLNDRVSFSTSLTGAAVMRTEFEDFGEFPGSGRDLHSLNFAVTIQVAKRVFVEPFVAFGLTDEATDFFAGINVPYRFDEQYPLPFLR
ncbi:transporter [Methylocaldum sp.]|uniref:transporter n=1 Tax=Methylocaldum sp. TaxID=1969727 RepID=UPI002D234268|nr:transporter [Methylocaldum sp.]HYE35070.1 transporter [Methylocaldum sp.]